MKKIFLLFCISTIFSTTNAQVFPVNDNPCGAMNWQVYAADILSVECMPIIHQYNFFNYTNASLTGGIPNPSCVLGSPQNIRDVWFMCNVPASGRLSITVGYGSPDLVLAAYTRTGPCNTGTYTEIGCNNDFTGTNPRLLLSGLTPFSQVFLRIFNNPTIVVPNGYFYLCVSDYYDNLPVVDNSTKVGVGATNPFAKLDVAGTGIFRDKTFFANDMDVRGNIDAKARVRVHGLFQADSVVLAGGGFPGQFLTTDVNFNSIWQNLPASANTWTVAGNNIFNNNTANIGIGNSDPAYILDLSKRMRLRSENTSQGAGIWFNNNSNTDENVFLGNDLSNNLQVYSKSGLRTIATFNPTSGGLRVEGPTTAASTNTIASFGGFGDFVVDAPGTSGGRFIIKENGNVGIGNNNPSEKLVVNGNILASGNITPSDIRYKKDIRVIPNAIKKLLQLNGVYYNLRTNEFPQMGFNKTEQVGLLAQDVEKVMPNVVVTNTDGYKGVDYAKLVPLLIESIKEQQKQIDVQQKQLEEQKKLLTQLLKNKK